ncbi:MAG TPA: ScpA family protein [Microbacteriaceae bacterium]|nr:ScpA family protein [Microbacteriaceae bacterium]
MAPSPELAVRPGRAFRVDLGGFEGPFDLLLSLIAKHEMDVTEVALARVADEFVDYLRGLEEASGGDARSLDAASGFLVVAATLLDLKASRLLPHAEPVDAEDVAALEARDLLFARLLQYRAFRGAAAWLAERLDEEGRRAARAVPLEERFRKSTPELRWQTSVDDFAVVAALALAPVAPPVIPVGHLHAPRVSIRRQAEHVVRLLRSGEAHTFHDLIADAVGEGRAGLVVARFVAVLELYRRRALWLRQDDPLGDLLVRWVASDWDEASLNDLGAGYE